MWPPSAPIYWNTRPLWYHEICISLKQLRWMKQFKWNTAERVRLNNGRPEYLCVNYDNGYHARIIHEHGSRECFAQDDLMSLIDFLNKEGFVITL